MTPQPPRPDSPVEQAQWPDPKLRAAMVVLCDQLLGIKLTISQSREMARAMENWFKPILSSPPATVGDRERAKELAWKMGFVSGEDPWHDEVIEYIAAAFAARAALVREEERAAIQTDPDVLAFNKSVIAAAIQHERERCAAIAKAVEVEKFAAADRYKRDGEFKTASRLHSQARSAALIHDDIVAAALRTPKEGEM